MRLFSFRYRSEALVECDFVLEVLWSKLLLASNPKGLKKFHFFPQGTENCRNLRYESLIVVNLKDVEISSLAFLSIK